MTYSAINSHSHNGSIPALDAGIFPRINPRHWEEWIYGSKVSEGITELAIRTLDDPDEIREFIGWKQWTYGIGYAIEGVDPRTGQKDRLGRQFKPDNPPTFEDKATGRKGKPLKYISPKGEPTNPLFLAIPNDPDYWPSLLSAIETPDKSEPIKIILTEGAKKAASGLTEGIPTIDVKGVWNALTKDEKTGLYTLNPELKTFCGSGVEFYLAFDGDFRANKRVKDALIHLSKSLRDAGCTVKWIEWDSKFKGLDDYFAAHGGGSIRKLLDLAKPWDSKPVPKQSTNGTQKTEPNHHIESPIESWEIGSLTSDIKNGLGYFKGNTKDKVFVRIGNTIRLIEEVFHEERGIGLHFRFWDNHGQESSHVLYREDMVSDSSEGMRQLVRKGYTLVLKEKRVFLQALLDAKGDPSDRLKIVLQSGWHDGAFVTPDRTYGDIRIKFQDVIPPDRPKHAIKGSLEDWKDNLGKFYQGNPRLLFTGLMAFVAPVIHRLDAETVGIHLWGSSSQGKGTALELCMSVIGHPDQEKGTWKSTSVGLEAMAFERNDLPLFLDEINEGDSRVVSDAAYFLANGQGKSRGNKDASLRDTKRFRACVFSTGEETATQYISESGKTIKSGQEVRLISIPAKSGNGWGIFDELHGFDDSKELADHIRQNARKYHGSAFHEFLNKLVTHCDDTELWRSLRQDMKTAETVIAGEWAVKETDHMIGRILGRFASMYCAGVLAARWCILPVSEGDVLKACQVAFSKFMEERGSGENQEIIQGMEATKSFIDRLMGSKALVRMSECGSNLYQWPNQVLAYLDDVSQNESDHEVLIVPSVFKSEVRPSNHSELMAHMVKKGWLDGYSEGSGRLQYTKNRKIPKQPKKMRMMVFKLDVVLHE